MLRDNGSISVTIAGYELICTPSGRGRTDKAQAEVYEEFDTRDPDLDLCSIAVRRNRDLSPFLIVVQGFSSTGGFEPGLLLIPATRRLFIGAGERLLAYDLEKPTRLWEDYVDCGFWHWDRYGDVVLMSAELEFAAMDVCGRKIWTTPVEPPWTYRVEEGFIHLDVVGAQTAFPLISGPPDRRRFDAPARRMGR